MSYDFDFLTGEEFERFLGEIYTKLGYYVIYTPTTRDYGADLIIMKNNVKTVIQAKRYSSTVGIKAIQEVIGAISYYNAEFGVVITNNYFTPAALNLAQVSNVELIDRIKLIQIYNDYTKLIKKQYEISSEIETINEPVTEKKNSVFPRSLFLYQVFQLLL